MKFAISNDQGFVSPHFGRCRTFTLVEVEGDQILKIEEIENPGHQPGFLPQFLAEKGVKCIICGGMGPRALALFREKGIDAMVGVAGKIEEVIQKFVHEEIEEGESMCDHDLGKPPGECHHKDGRL